MTLWAKVDVDMPTDEKLLGQPVATRHLWTCLICLAKRQDHAGAILGFDCSLLSGRFNIARKLVAGALNHFQAHKMVELDPDGTIRLLNFTKRQGEVSVADQREQWRDRQAKRQEKITREDERESRVSSGADHAGITRLEVEEEKEERKKKASTLPMPSAPALTAAVWAAYSQAFEARHGVAPPDSGKSRAQLKQFLQRVPKDDAPAIAAFYLTHNQALYVSAKHPIDLLLRDAPKLYADWKTNHRTTSTAARQEDATQANMDGWAEHMSEEGRRALVSK